MTLEQIRQAKSLNDIKPAIKYLCDNMQKMTYGAFEAYKRTLESQGVKVGVSIRDLNAIAEKYQVFGELL